MQRMDERKQIKLQRGEGEEAWKEKIARGSDIHNEGLNEKSVGKRGRLKGSDRKGGGEGGEERESAECIKASLVVPAINGPQKVID